MVYHIKNGKKILMADVSKQADWNQTDETKKDFIRNKPDFEGQIQDLRDTLDSLVSEDNGKIKEIEDRLKEVEEGLDGLRDNSVSREEFQTALDGLNDAIDTLTGITTADKEELEGKIKKLEDDLEELKDTSVTQEQLDEIMTDLEATIDDIKDTLEELKGVDAANKELLEGKIDELQTALGELKESVITKEEFDEVITGLGDTISDLTGRIETLESATVENKTDLEEKIQELKDALEELKNTSADDVDEIKSQIETIEDRILEIESALDDIRGSITSKYDELEEQIDELDIKVNDIKSITDKIIEYSVTYDVNGGQDNTCPESYTTYHNVIVTSNLIPQHIEKYFQGWALTPNATKADYLLQETIILSEGITLYAVWGDEKISFNDDDVSEPTTPPPTFQEIIESGHVGIHDGQLMYSDDGIDWTSTGVELPEIPEQYLTEDDIHWAYIDNSDNEIVGFPNKGNFCGRYDENGVWTIIDLPVDENTEWENLEYKGDDNE